MGGGKQFRQALTKHAVPLQAAAPTRTDKAADGTVIRPTPDGECMT